MTRNIVIVIVTKLTKLEMAEPMSWCIKVLTTTIATATQVMTYIEILISFELLVFINFTICGTPEIKNKIAGK